MLRYVLLDFGAVDAFQVPVLLSYLALVHAPGASISSLLSVDLSMHVSLDINSVFFVDIYIQWRRERGAF